MNESVIKIKSGQYFNLTFENDQYYNLNLKSNEYDFINSLDKNYDFYPRKELFDLSDINLYARFVGKSRIDNSPIFAIDLKSEIRRNKIEEITK
jgi:hypothetical protein